MKASQNSLENRQPDQNRTKLVESRVERKKKKKKQRTISVLMQTALFLGVLGQQRVVRA